MNVTITKVTQRRLEWLAKNWYVVEGEKPMPFEKLVECLVDKEWSLANPTEYAPFYERR